MNSRSQIPSLDGFRAISIVLVISGHLVINHLMPGPLNIVFKEFGFGELGVRIFFVISGFLITYLLLKERSKNGNINLKAFYTRRVLRIFPAFYFYLAVLALLNLFLHFRISALLFLASGLYIQNFSPWTPVNGDTWLTGHTWSLAVEEQFYLVWPTVFLFIGRINRFSIWIIVILVGSFFRSFHYKFPGLSEYFLAPFFMHADFLFSGCFIAFMAFYHEEKVVSFVKKISPFVIYCSIFLLWFFSKFEFHPVYDRFFIPTSAAVINVCIVLLIVYFVFKQNSVGYKLLNLSWIAFIGRLSYSIYLWQQLFTSRYDFWWSKFPQNIFLIFIAAYLSYTIIEKPFLRLKNRFKVVEEKKLSIMEAQV